jgi:phosphoglycerate dehydrogenase-like enzyme
MSWKVLITSAPMAKVGGPSAALLQQAGCRISQPSLALPAAGEELLRLLDGVDAVIAGNDHYSAEVLAASAAAGLKIISRWGVGFDAIDVRAATTEGIIVAYTPGMTDGAVADLAFGLLLAVVRHIPQGHHSMREGLWLPQWGNDMAGKTLGILGYGRIGATVARRARGFDLRVIAYSPRPHPEAAAAGVECVPLDDLLGQSDYMTLHAALTPQSRGLLGEAQFRRMKPTAFLVNTARGGLVDEAALLRALSEGWIAGAALDVFAEEPLPARHPFRTAPNLVLSPHQGSSAFETGERVSRAAVQAVLELVAGRRPSLVLNTEVFDSPRLRAKIGQPA